MTESWMAFTSPTPIEQTAISKFLDRWRSKASFRINVGFGLRLRVMDMKNQDEDQEASLG